MDNLAKERKSAKYISLGPGYLFTPMAIEILGAIGKRLLAFLKELGHRMMQCTGEVMVRVYLLQHIFIVVQRGNVDSMLGSIGPPPPPPHQDWTCSVCNCVSACI